MFRQLRVKYLCIHKASPEDKNSFWLESDTREHKITGLLSTGQVTKPVSTFRQTLREYMKAVGALGAL